MLKLPLALRIFQRLLGTALLALLAGARVQAATLDVPSAVYAVSYQRVNVPDAAPADSGLPVSAPLLITDAPAGAIVTNVEVSFTVAHERPGDLRVVLRAQDALGQLKEALLWQPAVRTATSFSDTAVTLFNQAAANQTWTLELRDLAGGDTGFLQSFSLRVQYLAPPTLYSPGSGTQGSALVGTLRPSLLWNSAYGASRYDLQLQRGPFTSPVVIYENKDYVGTSLPVPPGRLSLGQSYRWLVKSVSAGGARTDFGAPLYFGTAPAGPLLPPSLLAPGSSTDGSRQHLSNDPVQVTWQAVVGATAYRVRVSEYPYDDASEMDLDPASPASYLTVASTGATTQSLVLPYGFGAVIPGIRYRWTVSAVYGTQESALWNDARYFEVDDPAAPQISSPVAASGVRDSVVSYQIAAANSPTSYGVVDLPAGMSLNPVTGAISGKPAREGAFSVMIKAFNEIGGSNQIVIFDVRPPPPSFSSTSYTTGAVGQEFYFRVVATESPFSHAVTGLPNTLAMDIGTGVITGVFDTPGTYSLDVSATNSGGTGHQTLYIEVSSEGPYYTKLAPRAVHENQPVGTVVGNMVTLDGDVGQTYTHELVAGAGGEDNGQFQIFAGEVALRTKAVFDYETRNTYSVRVRTTDSSGRFIETQETIRVLNVLGETQGGVQLSDATIMENQPTGTRVGFLTAVDPDPGETFTFALAAGEGGEDNANFAITLDSTGHPQVVSSRVLDFESQPFHNIRIRVTDSGGNSLEERAVVGIIDDVTEDFDGDGLTQAQEALLGLSDLNWDTDGDGASDGVEVAAGTSPVQSSSFPDGTPYVWGMDPDPKGPNGEPLQPPPNVEYLRAALNMPVNLSGVVDVVCGDDFSIALRRDGTLVGWGKNVGIDTPPTYRGQASPPADLDSVIEIAVRDDQGLALRSDGTVRAWGNDSYGDLAVPVDLPLLVAIAAPFSGDHFLGLKPDGTVVVWGYGINGSNAPPPGLNDVVDVSISYVNGLNYALRADGSVLSWGHDGGGTYYGGTKAQVPRGINDFIAIDGGGIFPTFLRESGMVKYPDSVVPFSWQVPSGLDHVVELMSGLAIRASGELFGTDLPAGVDHVVKGGYGTRHGVVVRAGPAWPRLQRPRLLRATLGQPFEYAMQASGAAGQYSAMFLPDGLNINPTTGVISGTPAAACRYATRITVKNSSGWDAKVIMIAVTTGTPPAEPALSSTSVTENLPSGTVVGTLTATDADPGDVLTFSLMNIDDCQSFAIQGNQLVTTRVLDGAASSQLYIRVSVADTTGNIVEKSFVIDVLEDPLTRDVDGDGLTLAQENALGASDNAKDSDSDGAMDGAEVAEGTNPLDATSFPDGTLYAWGNPTVTDVPPTLSKTVMVVSGAAYYSGQYVSLALKQDGTVVGWGDNSYGQARPPAGLNSVIQVAIGNGYALALRLDGTTVAWGDRAPYYNLNLSGVVAIAAGPGYGMAVKSDGSVVTLAGSTTIPPGLRDVVDVTSGYDHNLALRVDGSVITWGGYAQAHTNVPAGLVGCTAAAAAWNSSILLHGDGYVIPLGVSGMPANLNNVIGVAAVYNTYCYALRATGKVEGWGSLTQAAAPPGLDRVVSVAAYANTYGTFRALAIRAGSSWPRLQPPGLLHADKNQPFSFTLQASGASGVFSAMALPPGLSLNPSTGEISGMPTTTGRFAVRFIVKNSSGWDSRVGIIAVTSGHAPTSVDMTATSVIENQPAGALVAYLSATDADPSDTFTFSMLQGEGSQDRPSFQINQDSGGRWQLLTTTTFHSEESRPYILQANNLLIRVLDSGGNTLERNVIIAVQEDPAADHDGDGLTLAQEMAAGTDDHKQDTDGDGALDGVEISSGTDPLNAGLFPDGTVYAWNLWGAQITSMPGTLQKVVAVSAGDDVNVFLQQDGTMKIFGAFQAGVAEFISGNTTVETVAAGSGHVLALRSDGTVAAVSEWGENGRFGYGEAKVPADLSQVVAIAAGTYHSLALQSDGTVRGWGGSDLGSFPAPVGLTDVVDIAGGHGYSFALRADGSIVAWGSGVGFKVSLPSGKNISAVYASSERALALQQDGSVVDMILWNGGSSDLPSGLSGIKSLGPSSDGCFAVLDSGLLAHWGNSSLPPVTLDRVVAVSSNMWRTMAIRSGTGWPRLQRPPLLRTLLGQPFSYPLAATGAAAAYTAMFLPPGLTLDPTTGILSGTPTQLGRYAVRFMLKNSSGWDAKVGIIAVTTGNPPTAIGFTGDVVAEDVPVGTVVARLSVQYAAPAAAPSSENMEALAAEAAPPSPPAFMFVPGEGDADNALFAIVGDSLVTAEPLDYETSGLLHVRLRATDPGANVIDQTFTLNVLDVPEGETLGNWRARLNVTDLMDDSDHDGQPDLMEYALGRNRDISDPAPLHASKETGADGADYLNFSFPRAFGGVSNPDGSYTYNGITYSVEWSADLTIWSSEGIREIRSEADAALPTGYRRVTARGPLPLSTNPRQFIRLRVTTP